jgi:uncharacterized protein YjbJ (UPF0337 family)|tara:strand:+ start:165 stop:302 length:138 start_codon:yes stop_codon:yes gene_type:complete
VKDELGQLTNGASYKVEGKTGEVKDKIKEELVEATRKIKNIFDIK